MTNEKHKHPTEGIQQYPGREETIMKNNPFTRFLSVALTAAMLVGVMPGAVLADAGEAIVGASSAVVESIPESTTPEDAAPVATEVPPVTEPEATPEAAQPEASPEVEATPETTQEPEATPESTEQPETTPETTQEPEATPEATEQPEATPEATQEPEATPEATEEPEATPEATEEPEVVEGVYNGMTADELFNAFLACQSVADVDALLADLTDEDLNAFAAEIGEDSMNALEAHFQALLDAEEPEEEPAEEEFPEDEYVEHVPEIVEAPQPVVPFTNAVPMFSSTLTSVVNSRRSMMRSALLATPNSDDSDDVIPGNGLQMRKWVDDNEDGSYTVNLEVWNEGTVTSSETTKPLDIVLVLDQSGSMSDDFTSVVYTEYTDQTAESVYNDWYDYSRKYYRDNTYVKLDNDSYSKVTVNRIRGEETYSYRSAAGNSNSTLYSNRDNLYYLENGQYYEVTVTRTGSFLRGYDYNYTTTNGRSWKSSGQYDRPGFASDFYYRDTTYEYVYEFTYTDTDGNHKVTLNPDDNAQTKFNSETGKKLYYTADGGEEARLDALVTAVDGFIASVAEKAKGADGIANTADDVHHRIAIVGFSSAYYRDYYGETTVYNNTELLTGVEVELGSWYGKEAKDSQYYPDGYAHNGSQYYSSRNWNTQRPNVTSNSIPIADYQKALQDVSTKNGLANVESAVDYLTAHGGTQTDAGMHMANRIFEQNPFTQQDKEDERDRVVIVFTDGIPTGGGSSYNSDVAEDAIDYANTAKTTYGADVYAIGIFEGADATAQGELNWSYDRYNGYYIADKDEPAAGNYFMQNLSSNNGYPQNPSYYLSASNSSELNAVFEAISETTGSSKLDLDSETVVKDVLTQYFTVPEGAEVEISTQAYDGKEFSGDVQAAGPEVTANINRATGEISVTGFDFSTCFISENGRDRNDPNKAGDYRGEKLIISFTIVPKEEFWGGNQVPTNVFETSGVFNDNELVENFPVPDPVDVPLKEITFNPQDRNIYYGNTAPTGEQLVQPGWTWPTGEDAWQVDYVNAITYTTDEDVSNTRDGSYQVTATLSPKYTEGACKAKTATGKADVYVYEPVITWQDTTQQAGTPVDSQFAANKAGDVIWKHDDTISTQVAMEGKAPTLTYTFAPAEDGSVPENLTQELNIRVIAVTTGNGTSIPRDRVTFQWKKNGTSDGCTVSCVDPNPGYQFRIHLGTGTLIIYKKVSEFANNGKPVFDFKVTSQGADGTVYYFHIDMTGANANASKEVVEIELPAGQYKVEELNNLNYPLQSVDGAIHNNGDTVSVGGVPQEVTFTNKGKNTNIPTDGSAAVNTFQTDGNGNYILSFKKEELGADPQTPAVGN